MDIVVQKYGGTSVNTQSRREHIISNALDAKNKGLSPVIVVSAMGRYPEPYATDTLLSLAGKAITDARAKDLLVSCGELISTVVVAEQLNDNGIKAVPLSGGQAGIITDENFGESDIIKIDTAYIMSLIEKGIVPVVAGFQGRTESGDITTLGRGGSDTSATALGAALSAKLVEIYTDVDGVMSADPNVVDNPELFDEIDYSDVYLLASSGAKVIHPRAVEYAKKANIDISILNVSSGRDAQHTVIKSNAQHQDSDKLFNAVTSLSGMSQVNVENSDIFVQDKMFTMLAGENISLDMINIFNKKSVFIIKNSDVPALKKVLSTLDSSFEVIAGFAKVTALGERIHGTPGVLARMMAALYAESIEVYQSSDSNKTISLLVKDENAQQAVKLLHGLIIG